MHLLLCLLILAWRDETIIIGPNVPILRFRGEFLPAHQEPQKGPIELKKEPMGLFFGFKRLNRAIRSAAFGLQMFGDPRKRSRKGFPKRVPHSGRRFKPLAKDSVRFRFGQIWENPFGISWHFLTFLINYWLNYFLKLVNEYLGIILNIIFD